MKVEMLPKFLRELPPPLGYQGIMIKEQKLNRIIYCLNLRTLDLKDKKGEERLLGYVHYPEVMFTIFHSVAGVNDDIVINCKTVIDNIKELRYKYRKLEKNITLD